MNAITTLTQFGISGRPFTSFFDIPFEAFIAIFIFDIKVYDNMIFWNFNIVKLLRVKIFQFSNDILPFPYRRFFSRCILSNAVSTHFVKYRFSFFESNKVVAFFYLFFFCIFPTVFEFLSSKTAIIISEFRTIIVKDLFCVLSEIVFKFLFKYSLSEWAWYLCLITIYFIHLPSSFKRNAIFFLKYAIRINNEIIEIIRSAHHRGRNIIVISTRIAKIYLLAMISNSSKFKLDLLYNSFILFLIQFIPRRVHINQSSKQTGLGVSDLDRPISAHK